MTCGVDGSVESGLLTDSGLRVEKGLIVWLKGVCAQC